MMKKDVLVTVSYRKLSISKFRMALYKIFILPFSLKLVDAHIFNSASLWFNCFD
jgi:hypothetical protein